MYVHHGEEEFQMPYDRIIPEATYSLSSSHTELLSLMRIFGLFKMNANT